MPEQASILVIDDSEDDRLLYSRALKQNPDMAYVISEAASGEEGLQHMQEEQPCCVLLDYSLPGRNGIEVLKRLRAKYPFVPVVMLTGQGNEAIAVAAIQAGAQNYIAKSTITAETLQRAIQVAVEHCLMQKRIHEQRASLEIFTRALAHDLKEPMRTICSFLELIIQNKHSPEKMDSYFQHVLHAAERMNTLIDTVYFYTRLDDPTQSAARELCDVSSIFNDVKENLGALIEERKAKITSDPLPKVYANRMQLIQVLQNLITNAIRHCDAEPVIHVCVEEGTTEWLFSVSDNGPGIGEAHLGKIFEPFKRLGRNKEQGLGLGLAICKKIIESLGGKIWYEPNPDAGAVFQFTLPKAFPAGETSVVLSNPLTVNVPLQQSNRRLANILLVDDSRADVDLIKIRLLERAHLQCNLFVARNGEEALALLHDSQLPEKAIDLVLLDINMPEMDGFEVLERLNADHNFQHPEVVMCTGSIYDKDMEKAKSLGAIGYLIKPLKFDMLKSVIDHTSTLKLCQEGEGYSLLRAA